VTPCLSYLRVSSSGQLSGDGYPRQREAISKYAATNGYEIVAEFCDDITGKSELENRPGLAACLERIENNGVKVVICEDSSRLARDVMVAELIVRQFQKAGGIILTSAGVNLTEGDDSNPTAALIRGILALMAEWDRRVIVLKLRAARERKKKQDGRCEGIKPFGTLPGEETALASIKELDAAGLTSDAIADWMNSFKHPSRSGKPWRGSVIRRILHRELKGKPHDRTH